MRKFIFLLLFSFFVSHLFAQFDNDIEMIKPIINFNNSMGGFYSDFFYDVLDSMYCGAEVENIGNNAATGVYLEVKYINNNNMVLGTFYSDTLACSESK